MDFSKFRDTGELSDINVMVDGKEFKLHKFPLFIKSDFFRNLAQSQHGDKDCIQLDGFPGGPDTFELVANYCYNVRIDITKENACKLRCAAEFLQMNSPGNLSIAIDRFLQDLLTSAKLGRNLGAIIDLVLQCEELGPIAEQAKIVDKCLLSVVDCWLLSTKFAKRLQTDNITSDKESFNKLCQLPLNWFLQLFVAARDKSVKPLVLANMVQMYISHAMETNVPKPKKEEKSKKEKVKKTHKKNTGRPVSPKAPEDTQRNETDEKKAQEKPGTDDELETEGGDKSISDQENREGDDEETKSDQDVESSKEEKNSAPAADEKAGEDEKAPEEEALTAGPIIEEEEGEEEEDDEEEDEEEEEEEVLKDEIDPRMGEIMDVLLLELPENAPLAETITPQWAATMLATAEKLGCQCRPMLLKVAGRLLHRIAAEDLAFFNPTLLSEIVEEACKDSHRVESEVMCGVIDNYLLALAEKDELDVDVFTRMVSSVPRDKRINHDTLFMTLERLLQSETINVTEEEKQELMETVDFSRLSESTLQRAYDSQLVPGAYITKAALSLCAKLRAELDATRATVRAQDEQLARFGLGSKATTIPPPTQTRLSHESASRVDRKSTFRLADKSQREHEAWVDDLRSELKDHLMDSTLLSPDQSRPTLKSSPASHTISKGATPDKRSSTSGKASSKSRHGKKSRSSRHHHKEKRPVLTTSPITRIPGDDGNGAILEVNTTESDEDDPTFVSTMTEYYELSPSDSDDKYTKPYKKVTWPDTVFSQTKLSATSKPKSAATRRPRKIINQTYNVHKLDDLAHPEAETGHRWVTDDYDSQYWYRVEIERCTPGETARPARVHSSATSQTPPKLHKHKHRNRRNMESSSLSTEHEPEYLPGNRAYAPSDWQDTISQTYENLMTDDFKLWNSSRQPGADYVPREDYRRPYEPPVYHSSRGRLDYNDTFPSYRDTFSGRQARADQYEVYAPSESYTTRMYPSDDGYHAAYGMERPYGNDDLSPEYQSQTEQEYQYSPSGDAAYDDIPSFYVWDTSDYYEYPMSRTSREVDVNLREWKAILQEVKYWREYVSSIIP